MNHEQQTLGIKELLERLSNGGAVDQLNAAIRDLNQRLDQAGQKASGTITFTLAIKNNGARMREMSWRVKTTLPNIPNPSTYAYADDSGRMVPRDPDQLELREERA
jgi:hypothetical protein